MSNSKSSYYGTNTLSLLGLLFIGLKLSGYINWSWWYVTLPFWGGLVLFIIGAIIYTVVSFRAERSKRKFMEKYFKN